MRRLLVLGAVLSALLVVAWVVRPISQDSVRDLIEPVGGFGPLVYVLVGGVLGALLVPGPLLAGASGLLFGTATGVVVTLSSSVVTALIGHWIGRRAGAQAFDDAAGEKVLAIALHARRHGVWAVIAQRLAPLVPDGPCNYAFGVVGIGAGALVLGALIGSAPRAFAYTALGDSLDDPFSPLGIVAIAVVVLTGVVGLAVAVRLRRQAT